MFTKQKEIRERNPDTTIFLNAGDFYQGTLWYSKFKYEPMIEFGNHLNYTAMGLGNHDFDDQIEGLTPFSDMISFPLLASNINSDESDLVEGKHYYKSTVVEVNGTKVGIIGYITQSTRYNFPDGEVAFTDEIASVRREAERLDAEGVKVIIALGHSGYETDIVLAEQIPLLDLVVGGHSHTFLYTPENEDDKPIDFIQGEYPTYVTSTEGNKVIPVVQAKAYNKYLGHLTLHFDVNGELKLPLESVGVSFAKPYLMDGSVAPDEETLSMMVKWQDRLSDYKKTLGYSEVLLKERGDSEESNIGNAITDSMIAVYEDASIAMVNNGGIRSSIPVGNITGEDIYYVLPFENTVDKLVLLGRELRKAIEVAASKLSYTDHDKYPGFGLQFSGVQIDMVVTEENNAGSRIQSFKVKNTEGELEDLKEDKPYTLAIGSFLGPVGKQKYLRGIFDGVEIIEYTRGVKTDYEAMVEWIETNSPIDSKIEGRFEVNYVTKL